MDSVVYDFVNDVISNYFTKLEIESTYMPLPIEITDSKTFGKVDMEVVSGGIIYNFERPISELNIDQVENSLKPIEINVNAIDDNLSISVPNTIKIINSVPPVDIIQYVITIKNNKLDVDYITLPNNIQPVEGQIGYWIYDNNNQVISSGLYNNNLTIR